MSKHGNLKKLAVLIIFSSSVSTAFSAEILGVRVPGTKQQSMKIPDVAHHELGASTAEIQSICEKHVEEQEMPCMVVNQGNEICYAYIDSKGASDEVQCFLRVEEGYVAN